MNAGAFQQVVAFESQLSIGSKVLAKWTNSHTAYAVPAEVVKINAKSFKVALLEDYCRPAYDAATQTWHEGQVIYPKGQRIRLPTLLDFKTWSVNNRAEPLGGYSPVEAPSIP